VVLIVQNNNTVAIFSAFQNFVDDTNAKSLFWSDGYRNDTWILGRVTIFILNLRTILEFKLASSAGISPDESGGGKKFGEIFFQNPFAG
jgi:hypothetical protein